MIRGRIDDRQMKFGEPFVGNDMKTRPLDSKELAALESERSWLRDVIDQFGTEFRMTRQPADIPTLQSLLDISPFSSGDEDALITLGGAFGDVVAETLGLDWVVVEDEYGIDFAIKHPTKMVVAFPLTMILKRVEDGEEINLTELYHGVVAAMRQQIAADGIAESD